MLLADGLPIQYLIDEVHPEQFGIAELLDFQVVVRSVKVEGGGNGAAGQSFGKFTGCGEEGGLESGGTPGPEFGVGGDQQRIEQVAVDAVVGILRLLLIQLLETVLEVGGPVSQQGQGGRGSVVGVVVIAAAALIEQIGVAAAGQGNECGIVLRAA